MNQTFDVIIVGGGIVGLSAAIGMQLRGFSTAIIDSSELATNSQTPNSRVYAINQASEQLLTALGAWQEIHALSLSPYQHMHVWDATSGACIDFDSRMIGADKLGFILQESDIKHALLKQAIHLDIALFPNTCVDFVTSNTNGVCLKVHDHIFDAKLLIVADGANSTTRECLKVPMTTRSYHQHAIVATVGTEKPHQKTAYQVFHPQGPLAFLPLADSHQCSIVWSTTTAHARVLMTLTEQEFAQQLTKTFANKLGDCRLISPRHEFPLCMRHVQRYSGLNWLLMGDAAHTIHPLAGLGLNVGLADLAAWLALLDANKQNWSIKLLGAYQRQRKFSVWQTIALMDGLKTIFSNPLPPIVSLRGLGLRACNRLPLLKRLFIEHAAGGF
jgi:2-octaprenylphenol hydroxylase